MKQELTTSKEIVEAEQKYKRECKGRALASKPSREFKKFINILSTNFVLF